MKRIGLVAFLILTIGLTTAKNCRAELTTIDEMLAVHRQNIERLQSLHLQATVTTEWTEAYRNSCRREVQNGEKLIGLLESGEVTLDELNPQLAKIGYTLPMFVSAIEDSLESNRVLANNTQLLDLVEIFVNGRDYQVRSPICLSEIDKTDWRFPAADLSAKSLLSNYSETRIYSRSQSLEPKARVWCGAVSSTGSPETALKLEGHFNESTSLALPPYLQVIASRWDSRHPIAEFFKDPAQKYELVQREVVDNQTLVVVDALIPHDYPSSRQDDDGNPVKFQGYDLYRVWLDVSRGAVPVKLQWWAATEKSDHERVVATQPKGTLTTSKILELASGGFYPATTVLEKYGAVVSEDQKEVLGYEVHERKTWDCSLVESPVVLPEDFFVLEFPQGQAFYDWDNHEMVGAIDHKPAVLPARLPHPSPASRGWMAQIAPWRSSGARW